MGFECGVVGVGTRRREVLTTWTNVAFFFSTQSGSFVSHTFSVPLATDSQQSERAPKH